VSTPLSTPHRPGEPPHAEAIGHAQEGWRIGLVGAMVAGAETLYHNVRRAADRAGVRGLEVPVHTYRVDAIERALPFFPASVRGTLRSVLATRPLLPERHLDAVWTQIDLALLPWLLTAGALRRVPVVYSADSTPRQLRSFGELYGWWGGRAPAKAWMRDRLHAAFLHRVALALPWTQWAARSLREDYGMDPDRIRVLPPSVDTAFWSPGAATSGPMPRAIFVGGDFERKGGDLLLEVFRESFRARVELDLVTRSGVTPGPGVRVHTDIRANDPRLLQLYRQADLLVIPTRADCFSMAGLEALSCGLPVITCPVGGVAELMEPGRQGLFVPVDDRRALTLAVDALLSDPQRRAAMGAEGRRLALTRYDADRNTATLLHLIEEVVHARASRS
jgi:glycosyltransferase involved in cell wall biosynthesis